MKHWLTIFVLLFLIPDLAAEPIKRGEIYVKDGDTIIAHGREYRLVDFDTPETKPPQAKCPAEIEKGILAAARLIALINSGQLDLEQVRCSCRRGTHGTKKCNYGRLCGRLRVNGQDVGNILIDEKHAVAFHCSATKCPSLRSWCD